MVLKTLNKKQTQNPYKYIFYLTGAVFAVIIILAVNPIVSIPTGNRGILLRFGAIEKILPEGLNFKMPFIDEVKILTIQTQIAQTDASSASKNLQDVKATIAVNYHISPDGISWLYTNLGTDFKGRVIDPAIQEAVKAVTAQYPTEELISKRAEVRTKIEEILIQKLKDISKGYIIIDAVNIVNFQFSGDYTQAIEAKATAEQKLGEQQRQLEIIKVQAEQAVAQAKGEAEAKIAKAEAEAKAVQLINEQLKQSPQYVQWVIANKWDGQLPQYMFGGNTMPLLQLPVSG
jgi:regulator of protease activity HflC (stomatin/prohibitin superfamily)